MKKFLVAALAAGAAVGVGPALAQTAPAAGAPGGHSKAMKPVTRAEVMQKAQAMFAKLDTDRDGFVTKAEAEAAREKMLSQFKQRAENRREGRFDRLDSNNDGAVSREEFATADAQRQQRSGERAGKRGGMRHMAGLSGRMFDMADLDKDGRVSAQEATQIALQHFDRADTNRDGILSPEEMRAARSAMRSAAPRR